MSVLNCDLHELMVLANLILQREEALSRAFFYGREGDKLQAEHHAHIYNVRRREAETRAREMGL